MLDCRSMHRYSGTPVGPVIQKMWDEEREHLDTMEKLAAKHNVRHTILAPIFGGAAYVLGLTSALLGKEGAMACTIAVEELIGQHYNNQLKELLADDPEAHKELLEKITKMRDDELHHHELGIKYDGLKSTRSVVHVSYRYHCVQRDIITILYIDEFTCTYVLIEMKDRFFASISFHA
ncbi:hypothetical protein Y032_0019g3842 [Ancylostoma ceylanicum]|nr:hypothetical protein Y032_0019g3842 [Ancylostoma ceylanicum]